MKNGIRGTDEESRGGDTDDGDKRTGNENPNINNKGDIRCENTRGASGIEEGKRGVG